MEQMGPPRWCPEIQKLSCNIKSANLCTVVVVFSFQKNVKNHQSCFFYKGFVQNVKGYISAECSLQNHGRIL
jgi:hypothetical protein